MATGWRTTCLAVAVLGAAGMAWGADVSSAPVVVGGDNSGKSVDQIVDAIKNPFKGFIWGADERIRQEYILNATTLNEHAAGHEMDFGRYRTRLWGSYDPCEFLQLNGRLAWEFRHYYTPNSKPEWDCQSVFVDTANIKVKSKEYGLTLIVGRQDIIFGDGWLVLEGTPYDGSTSIYFDAVRVNWDAKPVQTMFDLIYINNGWNRDTRLGVCPDIQHPAIEQNEQGAIFYASNKTIKDTTIDGYFIYKHDDKVLSTGNNDDIYTFGTRWERLFNEHLKGRVEGAGEFGSKNSESLCAWGVNSRLTYMAKDQLDNQFKLNFEALSGNNPNTSQNEQFDPLWGRWPQWSELYVYTYAIETRVAETTNLLRFGPGWQCTPMKDMGFFLDYNVLFALEHPLADVRPGFATGNYRGQLISAVLKYKFNRYVSGHIWTEYFCPGDYYKDPRNDGAFYLRGELVLTF